MRASLRAIEAVAIDLDGTMVDTAPDFHDAVNVMLAALDLPAMTLPAVMELVGKGTDNLIRGVLAARARQDSRDQLFEQARRLYMARYQEINGDFSAVYPGVREGLAALQDLGLRLACVTNKPEAFARQLLQKTGLIDGFSVLYGGDSLARRKPDPLPLQTVAQDFDIATPSLLVIGDSSNDAAAARAAGCPVVIVPYGYNHGLPVQTIDADGIVETLHEAAQLLAAGRQEAGQDRRQA